jgi:hypothetical protein
VLLDPSRFKVVVCGRRWGKSTLAMLAALRGHGPRRGSRLGAMDGANIWWVVPEYPLSGRKAWRDLYVPAGSPFVCQLAAKTSFHERRRCAGATSAKASFWLAGALLVPPGRP